MSIANFSRVTVRGFTQAEALDKAPYQILGNATAAFNHWKAQQTQAITQMMENQFMLEYLERKTKYAPGLGFFISIEDPSGYRCKNPWILHDVIGYKSKIARKELIDVIEVIGIDKNGNRILFGESTSRREPAMEIARQAYRDGFTGTIEARHVYHLPPDKQAVSFVGEYNPGRTAVEGVWICFGIENKPMLS